MKKSSKKSAGAKAARNRSRVRKPLEFKPLPNCQATLRPDMLIIDDPQTREIASVNTNALKRVIGCAGRFYTTFVEDKPKEGGAK